MIARFMFFYKPGVTAIAESTVSGCKYRRTPSVGRHILIRICNLPGVRNENPVDRVVMGVVEHDVTKQPKQVRLQRSGHTVLVVIRRQQGRLHKQLRLMVLTDNATYEL